MAIKLTGPEEVTRSPLLSIKQGKEPRLSEDFVGQQAAKYDIALGDTSPGQSILSSAIVRGQTEEYRRLAADRERLSQMEARNDILGSIFQMDPSAVDRNVVDVVQGLSNVELSHPDLDSIIEEKYARSYTNVVAAEIDNGILDEALEADPEATHEILDRAERIAFKKNLMATEASKLEAEIQDMSWGAAAWDFTETMVPFVSWYQKINQVGTENDFVSSVLPGSNLQEQYAYLWGIQDHIEFKNQVTSALADLKERNLYTAREWLQGFFSYGQVDSTLENLFAVTDTLELAAAPVAVLKNAMKGAVRGAAKNPTEVYKHAADLGKYDSAADGILVRDLAEGTLFSDNIPNLNRVSESLPSMSDPMSILRGADKLPVEAQLRLKEAFVRDAKLVEEFLVSPNLIDRANPEDLLNYTEDLRRAFVRDNPSVQKNVIDVSIDPKTDIGNVYRARISIGQRTGNLFESEAQARTYMKRYVKTEGDFEVTQVGQGFRVDILRNVDESSFYNFELPTSAKTPESFANSVLNNLRSANYVISRDQELARSTSVTSMERLVGIFEEIAAPIQRMKQKEFVELQKFMNSRKDSPRHETYADFEVDYVNFSGRMPSLDQTEGYFAASRIHDLDYIVRDLDVYKQKASLGIEKISMRFGDETLDFEGKVVEDLPFWSDQPFRYVVVTNGKKQSKPKSSQYASATDKETLREMVSSGRYKIVQASEAMKVGDKEYADFILTDSMTRGRVGVQNFERRPELGHKVDTYDGYIKQGKISKDSDTPFYRGDTTLFGAKNAKEGREFVEQLEVARKMFLNNDPGAMKYVRDTLGIDTKRWSAAVADGTIDLSVPFSYTKKGRRTIDSGVYSDIPGLKDTGSSPWNLQSQVRGRYLGERDESSIDVVRSEGDMVFDIGEAEYLSPMDTIRRSSANVLTVRMMNDYTMMTHRDFLREFGDILEGTRSEHLASGIDVVTNPRFKSDADPARRAAAENVSMSYRNLLNMGTQTDRKIEYYKEKLINSIIPKRWARGQQWLEDRALSQVKDPGVWMRSFAFNTKLGMFNPIQYFVQANSLVNVASIAGQNGVKGTLSYPFMRAAALTSDPDKIAALGKAISKTGLMTSEEFIESMNLYKKSGFHTVGRDTAFLDDVRSPELRKGAIRGTTSTLLSWGRTPFQEGERVVRMSAWQAAYLEHKGTLRGRGLLTRRDEAAILQRAKDLTANMTRESNAPWQKGYAAVFTQFWGYQARVMEQFIGKKLTAAEKARLFTGYSLMYGIPVAAGAGMGFIPWRDIILDQMMAQGYNPDDTAIEPFIDGFASAFMESMFGTELNIADRYGPGGIPTFYDMIRGDAELSDWLMGASGSILFETVSSAWPAGVGMWSWINDGEGGYYNLKKEDFLAPLRNISTVDNMMKLYQVYNYGIWTSKNETNIIDMSLPEGVIAAFTGLQPGAVEDSFRAMEATKAFKDWKNSRINEATKQIRIAMKMEVGDTREKRIREIKAQMLIDGLDVKERNWAFQRALSKETFSDSVMEKFEQDVVRKLRRADRPTEGE